MSHENYDSVLRKYNFEIADGSNIDCIEMHIKEPTREKTKHFGIKRGDKPGVFDDTYGSFSSANREEIDKISGQEMDGENNTYLICLGVDADSVEGIHESLIAINNSYKKRPFL